MREAMAPSAGSADPSRRCKRFTVVIWAFAHLIVTLYVLCLLFNSSTSQGSGTVMPDCLRGLNPYRSQTGPQLTKQQLAKREAAIEFRRQAAPLRLILRVKDIEAEVALETLSQAQVPGSTDEKEDLKEQLILKTGQQEVPAATVGATQLGTLLPSDQFKCYPEANTDIGGIAVRWGLTYHVSSAAECCKACSKQAAYATGRQRKCNVWVFCPEKDGCPSPDGYEHKFGECWLKQADKPRVDVNDYSLVMRDKSVPPLPVLWISGVRRPE
ncbi:hypothetical protein M758_5G023300 [Ceratodon purpureus]|nr:hypothetical protein M758_5G023300 [Ceratodon purpureus]